MLPRQLVFVVSLFAVFLFTPPPQTAPTAQSAQRMQRVGQLGGLVSAVSTDGVTALVAEGESLVRLDISGEGPPPVIASLNLEHGVVQDLVEAFPLTYALTEEGLVVLQGVHDAPLPQPVTFVPGGGQAMALGTDAVYVAAREAGLRVVNVSVPQQAHLVAELPLPGPATDVAVSPDGTLAFVAASEEGLHVIGLQNPAQPTLLGTLQPDGIPAVSAVAAANSSLGPLLYAGGGDSAFAFELPTLAQSETAQRIGAYEPLVDGRHVALSPDGDFAFVADDRRGLKIYDLSVPRQPLQIYSDSSTAPPGSALDAALSSDGEIALVAAGERGLRILDVSNPFSPVERFVVPLPGHAQGVAFSSDGRQAYVALGEAGIALVDVTTAGVLGVFPVGGEARAVVADGRWVYVALGAGGLSVLRSNGTALDNVASLELPGEAINLTLTGDTLFVAGGAGGLIAIDVIRPPEPAVVGQLAPETDGARYTEIAISGKRAFVADGAGIAVIDVADPARMVPITRIDAEPTRSVALYEEGIDRTLVALSQKGLATYDVSVSTDPTLIGAYRSLQEVSGIVPNGDRLLLTNAGNGPTVLALNASNPRLPREEGWHGEAGHSAGAAAHEDTVLVAGGLSGLSHLAFDEEARLTQVSAYNPLPDLTRLVVEDGWLLGGGGGGWSLIRADDPAPLQPVGRAGQGLNVRDLARDGSQAVIVAGQQLLSYDISDPQNPQLQQRRAVGGLATGVAVDERYIYVADGTGGLEVFARADLRPIMRVSLPAGANGITLDRDARLAYLPLDSGELAVVDVAEPTGGLRSLGTLDLDAQAALAPTSRVGRVLALDGRNLMLLDATGELTRLEQAELRDPGNHLVSDGIRAGVTTPQGEFVLYAITNVSQPARLAEWPIAAEDAVAYKDTFYVAMGEAGLAALPPDADQPMPISEESVAALLLAGDALYAAGTSLSRYDLSDPSAPRLIASALLTAPARHVTLGGVASDGARYFYVSTVNGMDVVHESPENRELALTSQIPIASGLRQIIPGGNRAYAAPISGGLLVLNTADLSQPEPFFTYRSQIGATIHEMLPVEGNLLLSWDGGLELVEIGASSALPSLLVTIPTRGRRALDVTLANGLAYVSLGEDGVAILDVSQPTNASLHSTIDTPGLAIHAAVRDGTLYVADGSCGLRAIDVRDSRTPEEVGFWQTGFTNDVAVSAAGDVVYAGNGDALLALRYAPDAPPVLPPTPRDPTPVDGQVDVGYPTQLAWGPSPDPCNPLRYEVALGVGPSPPLLGQVAGDPALDAGELRGLTTYHWQVRAVDTQGDMVEGPSWTFTTGRGRQGGFVNPDEPPLFIDRLRAIGWIPYALGGLGLITVLALRRQRRRREERDEQ